MPTPPRNPRRNRPASPFRLQDGMIYILLLDGVAQRLDERLLVKKANEFSRALGHIANYTLFTHGTRASLDPTYLERSDNYAIVGQTASQVRMYWRDRQSKKSSLRNISNHDLRRNPFLTNGATPSHHADHDRGPAGKLAGLSVHIARSRWQTLRATAEARLRLDIDARQRYVPTIEELLALTMIQEIGQNRSGHRSKRSMGSEEFLREKLLTKDGFEAALNSPATVNLLDSINDALTDEKPAFKDPREEISMHERHRDEEEE